LIIKKNIGLQNFANYQKEIIEALISEEHLMLTAEGYVKPRNMGFAIILGKLHRKEVLSYYNYPVALRSEMDKLSSDKKIEYENKLFSRPERNYLNCYLNKNEYTDGFDLRNKYLHGTNSASADVHEFDYHRILKLIILLLLKIEDDLRPCE
jgi:folate-dependent tRNA-U54 methylase TrmFO/GidA